MNYRTDSHSLITATSLIDEYYGTCSEKENFSLTVIELGMILKEAFPDAKRVQRRVNGVRMWHYTLAKIEQTDHLLLWENIPNFTSMLGWHLSTRAHLLSSNGPNAIHNICAIIAGLFTKLSLIAIELSELKLTGIK